MTRIRRTRWIVILALSVTAIATLAIGAQAFADRSDSQCAPHPTSASVHTDHRSWRTGALRSVGCRALRHMHHHRSFARTGR
ncbi:MAG: hypothetical protein AUI14_00720 [Actinobacteria bacterium 13_2_20CM_2_71_6]|nr:MAG: hypothetical protein AUI14_00720 [Actinobacteria bacterium 13_2_20CM_2_71_6]